ncbi:MAG: sulfurtransferase [Thermomicrobiales bacterium]|nr:sulfurtransferase [Thermomicrobiales bacterium]
MHAQAPEDTPLLVSTDWLSERIAVGDPALLVIDVSDLRDYRSAHIPGAIHSYWLETVERDYDFYGTVLNQKDIGSDFDGQGKRIDWLKRHGISADSHVIAYDRVDARRASRIVWFLRFIGHEQASLLDGGFAGWQTAGLATSNTIERAPQQREAPIVSPAEGFWVATERLAELLETNQVTLVDIRTDDERRDTMDGQFETGIIPGSIRVPWTNPVFDLSGALASFDPAATRQALAEFGVTPEQRVILYGRFGSDCNQMWVALRAAGFESVEIYDRGWAEWSRSGRSTLPLS